MVMDAIALPDKNETVLHVRRLISERGAEGWDKAWSVVLRPIDPDYN